MPVSSHPLPNDKPWDIAASAHPPDAGGRNHE